MQVSELSSVKAIAAGGQSSFAVLTDNDVKAWGANAKGQLGDGSTTSTDVPVAVKGVVGVQAVAAGETHTLALTSGGNVYAWGDGTAGELGNGEEVSSEKPVEVTGISSATAIAAGANYSLALLSGGSVSAWGANHEGQLGNGTTTGSDVPVSIPGIHEVSGIAAGALYGLAYGPKLPTVSGVSPGAGPATGATSVTITGTGFSGVKSVQFGSHGATEYTVESETMIHAVAPAGTGDVDVTVTLAGGTSPANVADHFSYLPVGTGLSPAAGPQAGGTEVVISGVNLTGVSAVKLARTAPNASKSNQQPRWWLSRRPA